MPERDSGFPVRLTLPTVAPGQIPGALRFVSLALHILRERAKAPQARFSEEVSGKILPPETRFLKSSAADSPHTPPRDETRSAQQAWMYSRNPSTITSAREHRQPAILHPTGDGSVNLAAISQMHHGMDPGHNSCFENRFFASLSQDLGCGLTPAKRLDLLIPCPASTLQIFQFIRQLVPRTFLRGDEEGSWASGMAEV